MFYHSSVSKRTRYIIYDLCNCPYDKEQTRMDPTTGIDFTTKYMHINIFQIYDI